MDKDTHIFIENFRSENRNVQTQAFFEIQAMTLDLIDTEEDLKYRKKYAAVWRK